MLQVRQQIKKEINLKSYDNRILITGLDSCISKDDFILELVSYINTLNEDIIFLSLNEREGPERWIIQWCKENDYPIVIIEDKEPFERLNKASYLSSNILIFTNINNNFKALIDLAKKHKTKITKVLV